MDTITDNLVVAMDDAKIWSTSKTGGYPTASDTEGSYSTKFYNVPTA